MATPTTTGSVSYTPMSGNDLIDSLLGGTQWTSSNITYSFPTYDSYWSTNAINGYGSVYGSGEPWSWFYEPLTTSEASRFTAALQTWANVANIKFTQVLDNTTVVGDIRVAYTDTGDAEAWAYSPGSGYVCSGDIWINTFGSSYHDSYADGTYSYSTLIHEIGHAIGLKHPFETDYNNSITLENSGYGALDSIEFTVMSYSAVAGDSSTWLSYEPTTPMVLDILAVQHIYGANTTYNNGNNTYTYYTDRDYLQTIYDTGGNDTIRCIGSEAVNIDLWNGYGSAIGNPVYALNQYGDIVGQVGLNVWIAVDVDIENATGGAGDDTLAGNNLANILDGGDGHDILVSGQGNDFLRGGSGADAMDGGDGSDCYLINGSLEHGAAEFLDSGTSGTDEVRYTALVPTSELILFAEDTGIETVVIGSGTGLIADTTGTLTLHVDASRVLNSLNLIGNAGNNRLIGTENDDVLTGNAGSDELRGGTGMDLLNGGTGTDLLIGGAGNDSYVVDAVGDLVTELADEGDDNVQVSIATTGLTYTLSAHIESASITSAVALNIIGNDGDNLITGNGAANKLDGGAGIDTLSGGAGNDTYVVDNTSDAITENSNEGTDLVQATASYSLSANLENLTLLAGSGNINGTGNTQANILTGNSGNNILDGGTGADTLLGGAGSDTYIVDQAGDKVYETTSTTSTIDAGGSADEVQSSISYTLGNFVEKLTLTGSAAINGTGNSLTNILTGNDGNNLLDGKTGIDSFAGGLGDDTYIIDREEELALLQEAVSAGSDTLKITYANTSTSLAKTITLADNLAHVEHVTITSTGLFNVTGNGADNTLIGNGSANTLSGGTGNDFITGGAGSDRLIGGAGNDSYVVDAVGDLITELADEGDDSVQVTIATAGLTYTLSAHIESASITSAVALNIIGNDGNNLITGNGAANKLDGGAGIDTLSGGAGNDIYVVDNTSDIVTENSNEGTDLVQAKASYSLSANLENLTLLTSSGDIDGTGNTQANILTGNSGNNILDGGAGADTLLGGAGNDTYIVDQVGDKVHETTSTASTIDAGGSADEVQSSISYTLGNFVEHLTLTGSAAINGTGNSLANILTGNDGNNLLDGKTGVDSFAGGLGNDIYIIDRAEELALLQEAVSAGDDTLKITYANASTTVTKTITLADSLAHVEHVTITGTGLFNVTGNEADNTLIGNGSANTLSGGAGNDILNGGAGTDRLIGGQGDDLYVIDRVADQVDENFDEGSDTLKVAYSNSATTALVLSLTGSLANIEHLTLAGTGLFNIIGNTADNILIGNSSANKLDGGAGIDTLMGGSGNDTYVVNDSNDVVSENLNAGTDLVQASACFTLAANIENLTLLAGSGDINGTGNELANNLIGNSGNNTLDGGAGADTMQGGSGSDVYLIDNVGDKVYETTSTASTVDAGGNADEVRSSISFTLGSFIENLTLTGPNHINGTGNTLANTLIGNDGDNTLDGKTGIDSFAGGLGNDTYILDQLAELDNLSEEADQGVDSLTISFSNVPLASAIDIDLSDLGTHPGFANLENITVTGTGLFNLVGNDVDNILVGNTAINELEGNDGNDVLRGGLGNDILTGGTGADTFRFDSALNASTNVDTIEDFISGDDCIQLENGIFTKLALSGITQEQFVSEAGAIAHAANDFLLYNTTTGKLYYDVDGNDATAAVQFATLIGAPPVNYFDFMVT